MGNTQWPTAPSPGQTSDEMGSLQAGIGNLPGLSATIQRACNLAENPNASAADLAALIEYDPVLARKLLRLANSASYGAARRISSVTEAVVKLGFSTVRSLAVATSAMDAFHGADSEFFTYRQLWLHSAACAVVAQGIGRLTRLSSVDDAFTAALLHDVGKLVLFQFARGPFVRSLSIQKAERCLDISTERLIIGTSHAEIGRKMSTQWHLPPRLCESIGMHHGAGEVERSPLAALCCVADYICSSHGLSSVIGIGTAKRPDWAFDVARVPLLAVDEFHSSFGDVKKEARRMIDT
ncbi:MAG TPA: HDOD domain-containing protein [Planctomycetota bacterium]|nr:HDOD domain-containing protein [Planctomycetota bacterium]